MSDTVTFLAEVKKTSSKKLASLDVEYQVVLSSLDPQLFSLGLLPAETMLKLTVEVVS